VYSTAPNRTCTHSTDKRRARHLSALAEFECSDNQLTRACIAQRVRDSVHYDDQGWRDLADRVKPARSSISGDKCAASARADVSFPSHIVKDRSGPIQRRRLALGKPKT